MNSSVLENDDYVKGIKNVIQQTITDYIEIGPRLTWELCKIRIREFSICYCKLKSNAKKSKLQC